MATSGFERGNGGKFRKRPQCGLRYTPYDRPPCGAREIHGSQWGTKDRASRWFSKLVHHSCRALLRSASRFFSSFGKGLVTLGEHIGAFEEVSKLKSENPSVVEPSLHSDGTDIAQQELSSRGNIFFQIEQLLKEATFSRAETNHIKELLNSRITEPSSLPSSEYKNKEKIYEDSVIDSSLLHQAISHEESEKIKGNPSELEGQIKQQVNLHKNVTSREHSNYFAEAFDLQLKNSSAYMGSRPRKEAPSTLGLQSQTYRTNFPLIVQPLPIIFPMIPTDSRNNCMAESPRRRSTPFRISYSPYYNTNMKTNFKEYSSYKSNNVESTWLSKWTPLLSNNWAINQGQEYSPNKGNNVEPTRSTKWTPSLSNIRPSNHRQALKRSISEMDAGCYGDARRVRQKTCHPRVALKRGISEIDV